MSDENNGLVGFLLVLVAGWATAALAGSLLEEPSTALAQNPPPDDPKVITVHPQSGLPPHLQNAELAFRRDGAQTELELQKLTAETDRHRRQNYLETLQHMEAALQAHKRIEELRQPPPKPPEPARRLGLHEIEPDETYTIIHNRVLQAKVNLEAIDRLLEQDLPRALREALQMEKNGIVESIRNMMESLKRKLGG
jgi:hypothetical protein